jgi:hypothetical protein
MPIRQPFDETMQPAQSVDRSQLIAKYYPADLRIWWHGHHDGPIAMPLAYWTY